MLNKDHTYIKKMKNPKEKEIYTFHFNDYTLYTLFDWLVSGKLVMG